MTPDFLRGLQAGILADEECKPHVVTAEHEKTDARFRDEAIATILNARGFASTSAEVPAWWAKRLLIERGKWVGIEDAAADTANPYRTAAASAVSLAASAQMAINFLDPASSGLMGALIAAKLIAHDDKTALEAMSFVESNITADEVSRALRGPWGDEPTT